MNVISCLLFCVLLGVLAHMAKSRQRTLDAFARSLQLLCSGPPEMFTRGCCSSSMNRCLGYLGLLEAILGHLGAGGRENAIGVARIGGFKSGVESRGHESAIGVARIGGSGIDGRSILDHFGSILDSL